MLWNLFCNETTKLLRRALYWVGLAILLGMCVLLFGLFYSVVQTADVTQSPLPPEQVESLRQTLTWPGSFYAILKLGGAGPVGSLLAIILVGTVIAQEYVWRTINLSIGRGVSRIRVLTAKLFSLLAALMGWLVIPVVFAGVVSAFFTWQVQGGLDFSVIDLPHLGWSILRGMYALFPVISMTFCLALATRSTVTAVGIAAGYFIVFETLLVQLLGLLGGGIASRIIAFLPGMLSMGLLQANDPAGAVGIGFLLSPNAAAAAIAVFTTVMLGLSFQIFRRQDLAS
jgi:ABC-type transport system involved in multi-copper enzyme maturation permease subunit